MNGYHLGYRYDDSPIVVPDGTPAPPLEGQTYTQTARPGARAPHVWLGDGRSTLDLFGRGFVLLRLGAGCAGGRAASCARSRRAGVPLRVEALASARGAARSTSARSCWCGRTAMSPGAATRSPRMRRARRLRARGGTVTVRRKRLSARRESALTEATSCC